MRVHFSNQGNLRNFKSFVESVDLDNPKTLTITTHDKWVTVHPANLVLAAALAISAGKNNVSIVGNIPISGQYLDRMGLFDLTRTPSPFIYDKKESAGRFIPISQIFNADNQSKFIADMIPLLHLSEKNAKVVRYVIGELVRNVLEHAQSLHGAVVAARYYKKTNRISIAICDTGMGLWKSLQEHHHPKSDREAIRLALTPGVTGTTSREGGSSENAGAGLFFIKSIAKIDRNYFAIYSGNAEYTLTKYDKRTRTPRLSADPTKDPHSETDKAAHFQGTLVAVDISLDETKEFNDLMKYVGDVYEKSIRDRKRNKYKSPRFE